MHPSRTHLVLGRPALHQTCFDDAGVLRHRELAPRSACEVAECPTLRSHMGRCGRRMRVRGQQSSKAQMRSIKGDEAEGGPRANWTGCQPRFSVQGGCDVGICRPGLDANQSRCGWAMTWGAWESFRRTDYIKNVGVLQLWPAHPISPRRIPTLLLEPPAVGRCASDCSLWRSPTSSLG
jgi:hypothetical protein